MAASIKIFASWQDWAKIIDHTNLRPEAMANDIARLCQEAIEFGFGAVVVNPCYVSVAAAKLKGSGAKVATVIGFPLGASTSECKRFETAEALRLGAREVDMVLNIGALKAGNRAQVEADIRGVAELAHEKKALLKVILETGLLTQEEKILACQISVKAGTDFVKTSTGFLGSGATVEDVVLMRKIVGPKVGVKASGGIKTVEQAKAMVAAGADRLGTSSGVKIIREMQALSAT